MTSSATASLSIARRSGLHGCLLRFDVQSLPPARDRRGGRLPRGASVLRAQRTRQARDEPRRARTGVAQLEGQARQALDNVGVVLRSAGLGFSDIFHCTVMLADMDQWADFNEVYLEYFSEPLPTRSAFGVAALALGGLVELECQAYAGPKSRL